MKPQLIPQEEAEKAAKEIQKITSFDKGFPNAYFNGKYDGAMKAFDHADSKYSEIVPVLEKQKQCLENQLTFVKLLPNSYGKSKLRLIKDLQESLAEIDNLIGGEINNWIKCDPNNDNFDPDYYWIKKTDGDIDIVYYAPHRDCFASVDEDVEISKVTHYQKVKQPIDLTH